MLVLDAGAFVAIERGDRDVVALGGCWAGTSDVVDAAVVLVAADGDTILTSDPRDLVGLARAADLHVDVARV
ncbi:MAG TPA: hypothetical protein VFM27_20730 [Acidimicrobiales bacterium]|nr:hypothetical protein [Acidimicrobiales bacterium]